jgi:hypothetical protein
VHRRCEARGSWVNLEHQPSADLANAMLTTAVETWGRPWTPRAARVPYALVSRAVVDWPGLAKPPEKRKAGGSTPPLTTTLTCIGVRLMIVKVQIVTLVVSFLGHLLQADDRTSTHSRRSQPSPACTSAWDQR